MKRKLLLMAGLLLPICFTNAQEIKLAEEFKDKSNAEIVEAMRDFSAEIDQIDKFFNRFIITKGEDVAEEKTVKPFSIDTTVAVRQLEEAKAVKLYLTQDINQSGSRIKIEDQWHEITKETETFTLSFIPKKIFFFDGTVITTNIESLKTDFDFGEQWPFRKRIDSIVCAIKLDYVNAFDQVTINMANPKAQYDGKIISLKKVDKNLAEFMYPKSINIFREEGLNASGKVLNDNSSWSSGYNNAEISILGKLKTPLLAMIKDAEKDTLLTNEKFREKYTSRMQTLIGELPGETDTVFKKVKFDGLVKALRLYMIKGRNSLTSEMTIRPIDWEDRHLALTDSAYYLYGNNGNTLYTMPKDMIQINSSFYEDDKGYYYFDAAGSQLKKLYYYSLSRLTATYTMAQEDEQSDFILLDKDNKQVGAFDKITQAENVITARKGNNILIIAPDAHQEWIKNIDLIGEFNNGYAAIGIKDKYGFVNKQGKIIIPVIYDGVKEFDNMTNYIAADNLFAVQKGEQWGFVDAQNKTVIPFEYESTESFSYGITLAKKAGNIGLITPQNKIVAPFEGGASYGLSTNFGKRMYSLASGNYDYTGKKEQKSK